MKRKRVEIIMPSPATQVGLLLKDFPKAYPRGQMQVKFPSETSTQLPTPHGLVEKKEQGETEERKFSGLRAYRKRQKGGELSTHLEHMSAPHGHLWQPQRPVCTYTHLKSGTPRRDSLHMGFQTRGENLDFPKQPKHSFHNYTGLFWRIYFFLQ
jgi:hypothetical protein